MPKIKTGNETAVKEKTRMMQRIRQLGIPAGEMTESVTLAVSALLEKLDDTARELTRAQDNFAELEQLVDVDCVAPVPNRRAFMRRLAWAISMHERYGNPCCVLYFDINDFKQVNDTYGHAVGDDAIRHISRILLDSLRESDFMARLSGDEFAVIMYYARSKDAYERGAYIAKQLAESPVSFGSGGFLVTAAFGVHEVVKGDDPQSVMAGADAAMYREKRRLKKETSNITA